MSRLSLLLVAVLALGGCFTRGPQYGQYAPPAQPAVQSYPAVIAAPAPAPAPRGFFSANLGGPFARAPAYRSPAPASACGPQGCGASAASPYGYAGYPQASFEAPYLLDAGDRLRITVFGQEGLTNSANMPMSPT